MIEKRGLHRRLLAWGLLVSGLLFAAGLLAQEIVWIDVRTPGEYSEAHVSQAINIPYDEIETGIAGLELESDQTIYLYCGSGRRAGIAQETLQSMGYSQVVNVGGLAQAQELAGESGRP